LFVLSTTNFILVERFATDILIFILVFITLNTNKKTLQVILIFFGVILKYYPIFLTSIFLKKKNFLILVSVTFIFFIYFFYLEEIKLVNKNILEIALVIAYGSRTFAKVFYHLSNEYNFFINNQNYEYFRNVIILLFAIYSISFILIGYKYNQDKINDIPDKFNNYFIGGSSIYIGTFIIGSNFDYRLIFLIFTIPYIINLKKNFIKFTLIICYVLSLNSFLFQHSSFLMLSDIKHWIYYLKSFFVFFSKFLILTLLSFLLGSYIKSIKFFST